MPMPIVTPPIIWLRAVFALTMRPQFITLTTRATCTRGKSRSIFTSQKCAPHDWNACFLFSSGGFCSLCTSIESLPARFRMSV